MPRLSVWLIRTALIYLAAGFTFGALLLFHKGVPLTPSMWRLLPAHIEFVLIGWTMQLAMGVAFWILPRFARGTARGDERWVWAAYMLLNAGVLAVGLGQAFGLPASYPLLGRSCELLSVVNYIPEKLDQCCCFCLAHLWNYIEFLVYKQVTKAHDWIGVCILCIEKAHSCPTCVA